MQYNRKIAIFLFVAITFTFVSFVYRSARPVPGTRPGNTFPVKSLTGANGERFDLRDYSGKLLLVEFWNAANAQFRFDQPAMSKIAERFGHTAFVNGQGFEIISVSTDPSQAVFEEVKNNLTNKALVMRIAENEHDKIDPVLESENHATNFLLDGNGKVIARGVSLDQLERELLKLEVR